LSLLLVQNLSCWYSDRGDSIRQILDDYCIGTDFNEIAYLDSAQYLGTRSNTNVVAYSWRAMRIPISYCDLLI